jgi:hypothetical protein
MRCTARAVAAVTFGMRSRWMPVKEYELTVESQLEIKGNYSEVRIQVNRLLYDAGFCISLPMESWRSFENGSVIYRQNIED